jgi:hypothetical protein
VRQVKTTCVDHVALSMHVFLFEQIQKLKVDHTSQLKQKGPHTIERVAKRTSSNAHNINHHEQNTKLNKMTFLLKDLEIKT